MRLEVEAELKLDNEMFEKMREELVREYFGKKPPFSTGRLLLLAKLTISLQEELDKNMGKNQW